MILKTCRSHKLEVIIIITTVVTILSVGSNPVMQEVIAAKNTASTNPRYDRLVRFRIRPVPGIPIGHMQTP